MPSVRPVDGGPGHFAAGPDQRHMPFGPGPVGRAWPPPPGPAVRHLPPSSSGFHGRRGLVRRVPTAWPPRAGEPGLRSSIMTRCRRNVPRLAVGVPVGPDIGRGRRSGTGDRGRGVARPGGL